MEIASVDIEERKKNSCGGSVMVIKYLQSCFVSSSELQPLAHKEVIVKAALINCLVSWREVNIMHFQICLQTAGSLPAEPRSLLTRCSIICDLSLVSDFICQLCGA